MIRHITSALLLFLWLLVMCLTAAGYLIKLGVDALLTEIVTLFATLGKKIGVQ